MYTVEKDDVYGEKLIELGFSPKLICSPENCQTWYNHCKEHNLKFLDGSYGSLVHEDFDEYFSLCDDDEVLDYYKGIVPDYLQDHLELIRSKDDESVCILTSSPYHILSGDDISALRGIGLDTYVFTPLFFDYYGFVTFDSYHPLHCLTFGFSSGGTEQMLGIGQRIAEGTGLFPFTLLVDNEKKTI